MRASEHAAIGSPDLQASKIEFCGIGGYSVASLGQFQTEILINGHNYPIFIYVVADAVVQCGLLIGTDFLDTVEVNIKRGVISIEPIFKKMTSDEAQPEIFTIDAVQYAGDVDTTYIQNIEHRRAVIDLINNYKPNKSRELDIKMTNQYIKRRDVCRKWRET